MPLRDCLSSWLQPASRVFEVASGTGQHAEALSAALEVALWQPTEREPRLHAAIDARNPAACVAPARFLDVLAPGSWPSQEEASSFDLLLCINMCHIAPWSATPALFELGTRVLKPKGAVVIYGPFLEEAVPTAPSNLAFDRSLRERDPASGLRQLSAVREAAAAQGFAAAERIAMPANNLCVRFARAPQSSEA